MRRLAAATAAAVLFCLVSGPSGPQAQAAEQCDTATPSVTYRAGVATGPATPNALCVKATGHKATEGTLVANADGSLNYGVTPNGGGILRSRDGGASWQKTTPVTPDGKPALDPAMSWVERDPATGRLFASSWGDADCGLLSGERWAYSDNQGLTWTVRTGQFCGGGDWGKTFVGPPATELDRLLTSRNGYPNVVYHCSGAVQMIRFCWKSLDGGKNFEQVSNAASEFPDPTSPGTPEVCIGRKDPNMLAGNGVVAKDGTIYLPVNACGEVVISASRDGGETWRLIPVPMAKSRGFFTHGDIKGSLIPPNAGHPVNGGTLLKATYGEIGLATAFSQQFALDRDGTLYFTWVDARDILPYLSTSTDGGKTWTAPVNIAPPGVKRVTLSLIDVAEPGHVAIAFYGSTDLRDFDGYLLETRDARAAQPTFTAAAVSPAAALQPHGVSEPLEYLGLDFGPDGTPWAAFTRDTCVRSLLEQCDGSLNYNSERFLGLVSHLRS